MYIEADRVDSLFDVGSVRDTAQQRTHRALNTSTRIVTALVILLAVQRHVSPGLSPKQWLLFQYSSHGNAAFSAVYKTLKVVSQETLVALSEALITHLALPYSLPVVLDEAQLYARKYKGYLAQDGVSIPCFCTKSLCIAGLCPYAFSA